MGHLRLGRLPKHRRWAAVVRLIDEDPHNTAAVARAVAQAADERLKALANDPSLIYCFWVLTRVAWASRSPQFSENLSALGIDAHSDVSALSLISQISDKVRSEALPHTESGPFGEIASLALRRALTETVGTRNATLFGTTVDDIQAAFRQYSTKTQFALVAKRFFADFFSRTLNFFVDKEVSNYVGEGHALKSIGESRQFSDALDIYARQSARIMEDFAAGWYSKHNWQSKGEISPQEAQGFVGVALRKLRMELTTEVPQA